MGMGLRCRVPLRVLYKGSIGGLGFRGLSRRVEGLGLRVQGWGDTV